MMNGATLNQHFPFFQKGTIWDHFGTHFFENLRCKKNTRFNPGDGWPLAGYSLSAPRLCFLFCICVPAGFQHANSQHALHLLMHPPIFFGQQFLLQSCLLVFILTHMFDVYCNISRFPRLSEKLVTLASGIDCTAWVPSCKLQVLLSPLTHTTLSVPVQ